MNAYCCSRPISRLRFLRKGRYRPPVGFRRERPCQSAIVDLERLCEEANAIKGLARPTKSGHRAMHPTGFLDQSKETIAAKDEGVGKEVADDRPSVEQRQARLGVPLQHEPHEDEKSRKH